MSGPRSFVERLIVTLALAVVTWVLTTTPLPGLEPSRFDASLLTRFTWGGAGLAPLVAVFGLVHLARGCDPRVAQRLRRWAPLLAFAGAIPVAVLDRLELAEACADESLLAAAPVLVLGCAAGSALLAALGAAATRFGLGNGWLAVGAAWILAQAAGLGDGPLAQRAARAMLVEKGFAPESAAEWPVVLAAGAAVALLLLPVLRGRRRARVDGFDRPVAYPLLPAGLIGLAVGTHVVRLAVAGIYHAGRFRPDDAAALRPPGFDHLLQGVSWPLVAAAIVAAATVLFTFFGAALSVDVRALARVGASSAEAEARAAALERPLKPLVWLNALAVLVPLGVTTVVVLSAPRLFPVGDSLWLGFALASLLLDGWDELRAPADLVALGEAPRLLEADRMRDALAAAGIPCLVRRRHGWQPLGVLAAFVPLELSVARADVERARAVLEAEAPFLVGSPALDPPGEAPELATGSSPPGAASPA